MATNKIDPNKAMDFVGRNITPILYIGGLIVLVYVVKRVFPGLFAASPPDTSDIDVGSPTISQSDAILISNNLYEAMNKIGTDEQTLFNNITPLSHDDLMLVIRTFGVRNYEPLAGTSALLLGSKRSLQGWLKGELGGQDLRDMEALFLSKNVPF